MARPPLSNRAEYSDWIDTCSREYQRLRSDASRGKKSFLDSYGATNEAEFFAVATEQFFDQPRGADQAGAGSVSRFAGILPAGSLPTGNCGQRVTPPK